MRGRGHYKGLRKVAILYSEICNTDMTFNASGISGTTQSYTNNRIFGSTSAGTPPSPIAPNPSKRARPTIAAHLIELYSSAPQWVGTFFADQTLK